MAVDACWDPSTLSFIVSALCRYLRAAKKCQNTPVHIARNLQKRPTLKLIYLQCLSWIVSALRIYLRYTQHDQKRSIRDVSEMYNPHKRPTKITYEHQRRPTKTYTLCMQMTHTHIHYRQRPVQIPEVWQTCPKETFTPQKRHTKKTYIHQQRPTKKNQHQPRPTKKTYILQQRPTKQTFTQHKGGLSESSLDFIETHIQ